MQSLEEDEHWLQGLSPEHLMRRTLQLLHLERQKKHVREEWLDSRIRQRRNLRRGNSLALFWSNLVAARVYRQATGAGRGGPSLERIQLHCGEVPSRRHTGYEGEVN